MEINRHYFAVSHYRSNHATGNWHRYLEGQVQFDLIMQPAPTG